MKIEVDTTEVDELGDLFAEAGDILLRRVTLKGEYFVKQEVPKVTHNLSQGVTSEVENNTGTIIVSARSGRTGARQATVHYPSGKTKTVRLRPQPAFNYAEVVAKGRPAIRPKNARVLLIPGSPKSGESYLTVGGKTYILRPSAAATKPNPFDERAMNRLEPEIEPIADSVFREIFE